MADEEPESFIDKMAREVSIPLRAVGGRVFTRHADADNVDLCSIELKCWWAPSLMDMFDSPHRIGKDKHKPLKWDEDNVQVIDEEGDEVEGWSLSDCPIMLSLNRVDEKQIEESIGKNDGKPNLGRMIYYAPIQTDDGVVNDVLPMISIWVGIGPTNFELLKSRLLTTETPDFDLGINVEFPRGAVERGWNSKTITWDGEGVLPVVGAGFVWKRGDWDQSVPKERRPRRSSESEDYPPEPEDYVPNREHAELMHSISRLERVMAKLALPVWLVAGGVIAGAIFGR